jgi:hypothetical protein
MLLVGEERVVDLAILGQTWVDGLPEPIGYVNSHVISIDSDARGASLIYNRAVGQGDRTLRILRVAADHCSSYLVGNK